MSTENKNCKQPYSYHTFIFPFLFQSDKKTGRNAFIKCLPILSGEMYEDVLDTHTYPDKAFHDQYRYFNKATRNAIYTTEYDDSAIVWNYRYDIERMANNGNYTGEWKKRRKTYENPARFVIEKGDFCAELAVNGVRLKLFNTGVGMLIFELENYEHFYETCIIKINEYGRRVFMPFIERTDKSDCHLCADKISLLYDGKVIEKASGAISGEKVDTVDEIKLAPIIKFFLSNDENNITTSSNPRKNEFYIEPIVDDRMFVACIYGAPYFADKIKQWDETKKTYKYLSDAEEMSIDADKNLARRLYELMFVDGDGISCYNRIMLKNLLEKHIYARWLEYGTITGITEYSMITVTSGLQYLSLPFLTEYIEMVILVLAQRASLLAFERLISEIACGHVKLDMEKVQTKYIRFQSELLLQEVTAQQQGIEIYNMLLENLFINQQQSGVENQMKSLFEINSAANEKKENLILFLLAVLGVSEVVQIVKDWIGTALFEEFNVSAPCIDWISQHSNFCCLLVSVLIVLILCGVRNLGKKGLK